MYTTNRSGIMYKLLFVLVGGALFFVTGYNMFIAPPKEFPEEYSLSISSGQTLLGVSKKLYEDKVIRSQRAFELFMIALGNEKKISEGDYSFAEPMTVVDVVLRIAGRHFGIDRERITFPEGFSNHDMANRLKEKLPSFDTEKFLALTDGDQGYLFPDTYLFFPSVTVEQVILALKQNFTKKTTSLEEEVIASGRSWKEILTMASIIEKEAFGKDDRAMISGILWKRIAEGMPLQVDAPFLYLLGKESKDLTMKDLAMDSPYNTYKYRGLPPGPINNPGLASIEAALRPQPSKYLYYLHDTSGAIHYASTYKEHQENIKNHLRK